MKVRFDGYVTEIADRLVGASVHVVNFGPVASPARSRDAGHRCRCEDSDILFL